MGASYRAHVPTEPAKTREPHGWIEWTIETPHGQSIYIAESKQPCQKEQVYDQSLLSNKRSLVILNILAYQGWTVWGENGRKDYFILIRYSLATESCTCSGTGNSHSRIPLPSIRSCPVARPQLEHGAKEIPFRISTCAPVGGVSPYGGLHPFHLVHNFNPPQYSHYCHSAGLSFRNSKSTGPYRLKMCLYMPTTEERTNNGHMHDQRSFNWPFGRKLFQVPES